MEDDTNDILADLETAINYTFKNRRLLDEALTHRSYLNESGGKSAKDNERLEFFGDAIIDFFISHQILERFPDSREGELTRIRASLVDEESLASLAKKIGLGRYLRMGRGEDRSGGREKKSILADAYEALLAAVFLDGGILPVQTLVGDHFSPLLDERTGAAPGRDYKTEFQELTQALWGTTPRYALKNSSGPDHERVFTVVAFVGEEYMGEGSGRSKKDAEQAAAREGLSQLKSRADGELP